MNTKVANNKNQKQNNNVLNDVGNENGDQKKLRKLVNQMDINGRNFIILISEVTNYYLKKNYSQSQVFNKSVESLNLFLDDVNDIIFHSHYIFFMNVCVCDRGSKWRRNNVQNQENNKDEEGICHVCCTKGGGGNGQ